MIKPLAILTLAVATTLNAATIVTDSFNSYGDGVIPTGTSPNIWATPGTGAGTVDNGTNLTSRIVTDATDLFGQGTSNKFLQLSDTSTTNTDNFNLAINAKTIGQTGTISFNFSSPTVTGAQGEGYLLRIGTGAGNGASAFGLFINNGQLRQATTKDLTLGSAFATYSLNTVQSLAIVYNSSATDLIYGSRTLAAGKMDIYLNGSLVGTALDGAGGLAGGVQSLSSVGFTRKTSASATDFFGTLNLDNLNIYSGVELAAIPEPATTALLGGAATLLGAAFWCRRRNPGRR